MIRVQVICEGATEEAFIVDVIAPLFAHQQLFITARGINTSPSSKGGALVYQRVSRFIVNCLKEDANTIVTTFFDLYGLHNEFPCYAESQTITDVYQRAALLEQAFKQDIAPENSLFARRFIPYIQPYEFEGLLFTDIAKLIELEDNWQSSLIPLQAIRDAFATPEHINDSYEKKPSARLEKQLNNPFYRKTLHGTLAIQSIGIDKLCAECQHFSEWYTQLSQLRTE